MTALLVFVVLATPSNASGATRAPDANLATIRRLLEVPDQRLDLPKVKLTIDRMIDPRIDIAASLDQLDDIVARIASMLPPKATSRDKLAALQRYLYQAGEWNGGRPYSYDFDDPRGYAIRNKLLPNYLATKKGNCISMPFLFIILGQKLGIDVTASTAPGHVFVKYRDDTGAWFNIEATNGGTFFRDAWMQQEMPMTAQALSAGIYMQPLTKRETAAVALGTLMEFYEDQGWYEELIPLARLVLVHYPKHVLSMLVIAKTYALQWDRNCVAKYPWATKLEELPAKVRAHCAWLDDNETTWMSRAEALGWRNPTPEAEAAYLQRISKEKAARSRRSP